MQGLENIIGKIQNLLDSIPEDTRMIIIKKYTGEPGSKNVKKLLDILNKLSVEEKKEFCIFSKPLFDDVMSGEKAKPTTMTGKDVLGKEDDYEDMGDPEEEGEEGEE